MVGDNKYLLIRRIVTNAGSDPLPGDLETDFLEKYLTIIGGSPAPGDDFNILLRKIVTAKGGTPTPGDREWNLLVKWLETLGECRACGDSVYDLWRKILDNDSVTPPEPEPDFAEVRVHVDGTTGITDGQASAIEFGAVCQSLAALSKTFTVFNDGNIDLTTSGLSVPAGYTVTNPLSATIGPGLSDTFTVELASNQAEGTYSGTVSFNTNDVSEPVFNFPVTADTLNPIQDDSAFSDGEATWSGVVSWFWGRDECPGIAEPAWFGIEHDEDGGGFGSNQFVAGTERTHSRLSDGLPHIWTFRVAAFDAGFIQITDWRVFPPFAGP